MDSLTELFCLLDDFCQEFEPALEKRRRQAGLCLSELLTLAVLFHQPRYRQFKAFYLHHVRTHLRQEFPRLPSYQRCVALMPRCAIALTALFELLKGQCTGLSVTDSTSLAVCDHVRIGRHRGFQGCVARGKTSTGWFFGFKRHVVINHVGEVLAIKLTPGNVDDRKPLLQLCDDLFGTLYADKGYLAKWLTQWLEERGIRLVTKVRKT